MIYTINKKYVTCSLGLPSPTEEQNVIQFSEHSSLATIKALTPEELTSFMAKFLKPDAFQSQYTFPYHLSSYLEPIQAILSLLSQILRLDSDQSVTEVMIGMLYLVS